MHWEIYIVEGYTGSRRDSAHIFCLIREDTPTCTKRRIKDNCDTCIRPTSCPAAARLWRREARRQENCQRLLCMRDKDNTHLAQCHAPHVTLYVELPHPPMPSFSSVRPTGYVWKANTHTNTQTNSWFWRHHGKRQQGLQPSCPRAHSIVAHTAGIRTLLFKF